MLDQLVAGRDPEQLRHRLREALDLADDRHEAPLAEREADALVPEVDQVLHGQARGEPVVRRDERRLDVLAVAVDEHDRQAPVGQPGVTIHAGGGVGVQAGDEDDAADVALQQQLCELVLGGAARALRAEHGRVAVLGQRLLDGLGERREDRVVQLGGDQPDEPVAALAKPLRALVPHEVERRQDELARTGRHAGLAVQHAADRGLAHARLGCDVGQPGVTVHGRYFTHHRAPTMRRNPAPAVRRRPLLPRGRWR